jgi:hypothetical protein
VGSPGAEADIFFPSLHLQTRPVVGRRLSCCFEIRKAGQWVRLGFHMVWGIPPLSLLGFEGKANGEPDGD